MMTPSAEFARRAREARKTLGLSQHEIAERMARLGMPWHQSTVAKTEANARPITLDEAAALAEMLGMPLIEPETAANTESKVAVLSAQVARLQARIRRANAALEGTEIR